MSAPPRGGARLPEEVIGEIVHYARKIGSSPTAQLIKDMQEVRDFIFRSNYYDEYLDRFNPCEFAENPVCGARFDLDIDDPLNERMLDQFGADWLMGACGICPKCMEDKVRAEAALEDVRVE